jgi:hypothetical protein
MKVMHFGFYSFLQFLVWFMTKHEGREVTEEGCLMQGLCIICLGLCR